MMFITRQEVEIAVRALESIAASLEKIANPPMLTDPREVEIDRGTKFWMATSACNDDLNDPTGQFLGIYSSEALAQWAADKFPRSGEIEEVVVDEVPEWLR